MTINNENYQAYLIDYLHGELNSEETKAVEVFLQENTMAAEEFTLLQQTIVTPEEDILFEHKDLLYKKEEGKGGLVISYKRYFAIAAMLGGVLLSVYFMMKKEEKPSYVNHSKEEGPVQQHIVNQAKDDKVVSFEPKEKSYQKAATAKRQHRDNQEQQKELPLPEIKLEEEVVRENEQEDIFKRLTPIVTRDTLPTFFTQENVIPKQDPIHEEDDRVANRSASTRNVEWNPTRKPRLFRVINGLLGFSHKLKQKEEQLSNTQMTVMVGNKILFNINN